MLAFEARASSVLYKALTALGPNKTVLIPPNVCLALPATVVAAKRSVEFVDIDPATLEMDLSECAKRIEAQPGKYGALVFVRPYGAILPRHGHFEHLKTLQPSLLIVDDQCLCLPRISGAGVENSDLTLFSTGPKKQIDLGYGGLGVLAPDVRYSNDAHRTYDESTSQSLEADFFSASDIEQKTHRLEASWLDLAPPETTLSHHLAAIDMKMADVVDHKRRINRIYSELIPERAQLPEAYQGWRFNIVCQRPRILLQTLFDNGLFASQHYSDLSIHFGIECRAAAEFGARVVNLFNDFYFDEDRAQATAALVRKHFKDFGYACDLPA